MTQVSPPRAPTTSVAPPPVAPVTTKPPSTLQVATNGLRLLVAGTPGRLRVYGALAIGACLLFGIFAFVGATTKADDLSGARSDAAQLLRIQAIRINLVTADASLTNAFLVGGLEPPAERATYEASIANAARALAEAAGANDADTAALAKVNDVITTYTGLVESARANNRQGYPIGAAYLRTATSLLRNDALPGLEAISAAEQTRIDDSYSSSAYASYWLIAGLVVPLAVLVVAQVWLTRRTRRVFNLPLVIATGLVVVVGIAMAATMVWSQSKANDARSGAYFDSLELGSARVDAFDAKSAESLTLIARGSGQEYQARYAALAGDTKAILADYKERNPSSGSVQSTFLAYDTTHTEIRRLDDTGDWQKAVDLATGNGAKDSNALFTEFDSASAIALDSRSNQLRDQLESARSPLTALAWVALLAGIVAAIAAWRGISNRLREYR
jgi:hypothetical protein